MSPKSAQRFWENDMHQNKGLKRVARIRFDATRFSRSGRSRAARAAGHRQPGARRSGQPKPRGRSE
ncbi:hypothetical protein EN852_002490 [Mesorhizobium sp. M2E.F.Ca.ET.209.01.1.1]|nr:hypothetical protein EN852_002490 [Mesorhizobium sp. M2E.F.Ca.ET.209.01.1.1]